MQIVRIVFLSLRAAISEIGIIKNHIKAKGNTIRTIRILRKVSRGGCLVSRACVIRPSLSILDARSIALLIVTAVR